MIVVQPSKQTERPTFSMCRLWTFHWESICKFVSLLWIHWSVKFSIWIETNRKLTFVFVFQSDKYYCKICHSNKQTSLPGYMILKWDFSPKHYVSNFAFNYLSRIRSEPIFNLGDLNQNLFRKSRTLKQVDILRWSLYYFDQYISHCRLAEENKYERKLFFILSKAKSNLNHLRDKLIFKQVPMYIYNNPYIYSIDDLFEVRSLPRFASWLLNWFSSERFQIKSGNLLKVLENLAKQLRKHVFTCPICSGQGHICQICQISSDIIFPFDLEKNSVCQGYSTRTRLIQTWVLRLHMCSCISLQFVNPVSIWNVMKNDNFLVRNAHDKAEGFCHNFLASFFLFSRY